MPGPKMGARPPDFDEKLVRESPTFKKWERLTEGQKLRYACRDFIKGHGDDEERLMRRIMIARRNNLRDHEILKQARAQVENAEGVGGGSQTPVLKRGRGTKGKALDNSLNIDTHVNTVNTTTTKRRRCATSHSMTDDELRREMDTPAIEATRSYKAWMALPFGSEFTYNQRYIKGREGHDWLLRKNIWRRMRYRRHNKSMVEKLKSEIVGVNGSNGDNNAGVIADGNGGDSGSGSDIIDTTNTITTTMPAVPCLPTEPANPNYIRVHLPVSIPDAYNTTVNVATAVNDAAAAVTATQIVDHTLLATASATASASATVSASATAAMSETLAGSAETCTMPESSGNSHVHSHSCIPENSSEDNLHAAVVEAAVAAVAAAESYVKQARESEETEMQSRVMTAYEDMKMKMEMEGGHHAEPDDVIGVGVGVGVSVHNPIISDPASEVLDHDHDPNNPHHHGNHNDHDHHNHTPNPLVSFDGDALDVAAKLAAAASVQVCKLDVDVDVDGEVDLDNKQCMSI